MVCNYSHLNRLAKYQRTYLSPPAFYVYMSGLQQQQWRKFLHKSAISNSFLRAIKDQ